MRLLRLRGRKICDRVVRHGQVWRGKHMTIRFLVGAPRHPSVKPGRSALYVGAVASTKLDKSAVRRNRMRRRCREALRLTLKTLESPETLQSFQLLLAPKSSSLMAPFSELSADLLTFLSPRLHVRKAR